MAEVLSDCHELPKEQRECWTGPHFADLFNFGGEKTVDHIRQIISKVEKDEPYKRYNSYNIFTCI